jgi:hypothetical protein
MVTQNYHFYQTGPIVEMVIRGISSYQNSYHFYKRVVYNSQSRFKKFSDFYKKSRFLLNLQIYSQLLQNIQYHSVHRRLQDVYISPESKNNSRILWRLQNTLYFSVCGQLIGNLDVYKMSRIS